MERRFHHGKGNVQAGLHCPAATRVGGTNRPANGKQLVTSMRTINHGMNEKILAGLDDDRLELTAAVLMAIKANLLVYLQAAEN